MPEPSAARENQRIAHEIQTKFEFWLVGLIFAVLALAVQTASFDGPKLARACELAAWISLLLAGVIGIWRLEWTPPLYHLGSRRERHEDILRKVQGVRAEGHPRIIIAESGEPVAVDELITQVTRHRDKVDQRLEPLRRKQAKWYQVMRVLWVAGFALLLIARGYEPTRHLVDPPPETHTQEPESSQDRPDVDL